MFKIVKAVGMTSLAVVVFTPIVVIAAGAVVCCIAHERLVKPFCKHPKSED